MAKRKRKTQRQYDEENIGVEPETGSELTIGEVLDAYNYYRYFKTKKDAIHWLDQYLRSKKDDLANDLSYVSSLAFSNTAGWIARMLMRGCVLPESTMKTFDAHLERMRKSVVRPTGTNNVVEFVSYKPNRLMLIVEEAEDNMVLEIVDEFDIQNHMSGDFKVAEFREVLDKYTKLIEELDLIGADKQVTEAYKSLGKRVINKRKKFYQTIVDAIESKFENKRRQRKPRKKRSVNVEKRIAKFQYLKEYDGLVSINPLKIWGSKKVLLYDVKYNKATFLYAEDSGFEIKGTTIQNLDDKKSKTKKLRSLDVKTLATTTITRGKKLVDAVKSKWYDATGRVNKNILILKVEK